MDITSKNTVPCFAPSDIDEGMLKKYDRPGPRYTSYPTAPYFHEGIGGADLERHLQIDAGFKEKKISSAGSREDSTIVAQPRGLSLYFHIPFCDTLCWFCGCNTSITRSIEKVDNYLETLEKEIQLVAERTRGRKVFQMHWGGGTPTHLRPAQIRRLGQAIHKHFDVDKDAEISVEIDPRELTREHLVALYEVGFRRCSMGVQDIHPEVQKAVNRIQALEITEQAVHWARECGFTSVNVDLMYGLPFQTPDNFPETLMAGVGLNPDRFAVFSYAHLPERIKHQKLIPADALPTPAQKLEMLRMSIQTLQEQGYVYIGMDHFAKPDDPLTQALQEGSLYRNFQGYSTHSELSLIGMGASSISMLSGLYTQNYKKIDEWRAEIEAGKLPVQRGVELTLSDRAHRDAIVRLMCQFELDTEEWNHRWDESRSGLLANSTDIALGQLREFEQDGLVEIQGSLIKVTTPGPLFIRNIAMCFDERMRKGQQPGVQYSRTV